MTTTHPIVDAYIEAINAGDHAALMGCFSDDAVLNHPAGTFTGTEIGTFYRDVVLAGQAVLTCGAVLVDGSVVMAEITASSPLDPDGPGVHALDVFRLAPDGRTTTLDIYYR
ncbi:MAG TPA: nuclear transport factor 2 family protein [Acidimicrobiales bacterium]|nr:nuclear transport factor 2 family protein [Acidimicrobiales bacterium]